MRAVVRSNEYGNEVILGCIKGLGNGDQFNGSFLGGFFIAKSSLISQDILAKYGDAPVGVGGVLVGRSLRHDCCL